MIDSENRYIIITGQGIKSLSVPWQYVCTHASALKIIDFAVPTTNLKQHILSGLAMDPELTQPY